MKHKTFLPIVGYALYSSLLLVQVNQPPFERYPNWDWFWSNVLHAGKLSALRNALLSWELPSISPHVLLGASMSGETTMPASPFFPPNWLVLWMNVEQVIILKQILFLFLAGLGTYLFCLKRNLPRGFSFFAGLLFCASAHLLSNYLYFNLLLVILALPMLLILLDHMLEGRKLAWFFFSLYSIWTVGAGDVFVFAMVPPCIVSYLLIAGWGSHKLPPIKALKISVSAVAIFFVSSGFYLVPFLENFLTNARAVKELAGMGLIAPAPTINMAYFFSFFKELMLPGFVLPVEGSGGMLYVPVGYYACIIFACYFYCRGKTASAPFPALALAGAVALLFLEPIMIYCLPQAVKIRIVFRHQLNVTPYLLTLSGLLSLSILKDRPLKQLIGWCVVLPLALDLLLFGGKLTNSLVPPLFKIRTSSLYPSVASSNLVPIRFLQDMWWVLPFANALTLTVAILLLRAAQFQTRFRVGLYFTALCLPVFLISLFNELRLQQQDWQFETRNAYRWQSYLKRKSCIDNLSPDRTDPNYRTLYSAKDLFGTGFGRSWQLIAETEDPLGTREKMLFSYRETSHPYVGAIYEILRGSPVIHYTSNFYPAVTDWGVNNFDVLRLLGVRTWVSVDAPVRHPEAVFVGQCSVKPGPIQEIPSDGGTTYIYTVRNPTPVVFLAPRWEQKTFTDIIRSLMVEKKRPWVHGLAYLETITQKLPRQASTVAGSARILRETYNTKVIEVTAPTDQLLIVSQLFDRSWRVLVNKNIEQPLRAYGGLLSIPVPKGKSIVELRLFPFTVYRGILLTIVGMLLSLLLCFFSRTQRKIG